MRCQVEPQLRFLFTGLSVIPLTWGRVGRACRGRLVLVEQPPDLPKEVTQTLLHQFAVVLSKPPNPK